MIIDANKICYIFDVDGTLTEPREKISTTFAKEFNLMKKKIKKINNIFINLRTIV